MHTARNRFGKSAPPVWRVRTELVPNNVSPSQARLYFERHKSRLIDVMAEMMKATVPSAKTDVEVKWYMMTKTILIPKELEARHMVLKRLSDAVKKNKDIPGALITKVFPSRQCPVYEGSPDHEQAQREVETTWKPNITLYVRIFSHSSSLVSTKISSLKQTKLILGPIKGTRSPLLV